MGCCTSQVCEMQIKHRAFESQDDGDLTSLAYSSNGSPTTINDPIAILDNVTLNPLAYALWCGRASTFSTLKEQMGASTEAMEALFERQGYSGLEIIISKGYLDILKSYLPEFILNCNSKVDEIESLKKPLVHQAILNGHIDIIQYLFSYFVFVCPPPAFDLHYVCPKTGENSALICCKTCNLAMAKFLNEVCAVDFTIVNNKKQNALIIAGLAKAKAIVKEEFMEYLISRCRVDVSYEYEQIMEMLEDGKFKEFVRRAFLEIDYSKHSESVEKISNITAITKRDAGEEASFSYF